MGDAAPLTTLNSQWGRFLYTVGGTTLKTAYYDTAASGSSDKIKYAEADMTISGAVIKAASSASDCIITGKNTAASLYVHQVDFTTGKVTSEQLSTVTLSANMPKDGDVAGALTYSVWRGCTGFVLNETVFNKNPTATGTGKFVKNDDASAWTNEVYDRRGNFAWTSDDKLYMLNSQFKYEDTKITLDSAFFKAATGERTLRANSAKNRIILDSSEKKGGNYEYAIQMYFYTGTEWIKAFSLSGTSTGISKKYSL